MPRPVAVTQVPAIRPPFVKRLVSRLSYAVSHIPYNDLLCAEHDGSIASFPALSMQFSDLADAEVIFQNRKTNFRKIYGTAAWCLLSIIVSIPTAGAGAPAIATNLGRIGFLGKVAGTQTAISGLRGAALRSASLKAISLGASMKMGVAILTVIGAAVSGVEGAALGNRLHGGIKGFKLLKIKNGGNHAIIYINGFMSESESSFNWPTNLGPRLNDASQYHLLWESKTLVQVGAALLKSKVGLGRTLMRWIRATAKNEGKSFHLNVMGLVQQILGNPFHRAMFNANLTGELLAIILARVPGSKFSIIAHSLGGRVTRSCLESLATIPGAPVVENVFILGGADGNDTVVWEKLTPAVSGKIYNFFSKRDETLKKLYLAANAFMSKPIGAYSIESNLRQIENIDCTDIVEGHLNWKEKLPECLMRCDFKS